MNDSKLLKYSPKEGYMHNLISDEVTMTRKAANKRKYLLTKNDRSNAMPFEELLKAIEAVDAPNESELEGVLKAANVSDKGIEVAMAVAKMLYAYSDELDTDLLVKSIVGEAVEDEQEDISKSDLEVVPAAVRGKIEKALEENAVLKSRVDEITNALTEASEAKKTAEFVAKAQAFDNLNVSADELGAVLKSVSDSAGDDVLSKLVEILSAANAVAESGEGEVLKSHGSGQSADAEDPVAKADSMAREIAKTEGINFSDALLRVLKENTELEVAYRG